MQNKLSIFLLDDDTLFSSQIKPEIEQFFITQTAYDCDIELFDNIDKMLAAAEKEPPDLLIADIELPGYSGNGISASDSLREIVPGCSIIYLTSYIQYAMEIFKTDPLYFIIKDQYQEHLPKALDKFVVHYQKSNCKLPLHSGGKDLTVSINDIIYCEHLGKYVNVICLDAAYPVRSTLSEFAKQLPPDQFVLCHKSFLINLAYASSVSAIEVVMSNGEKITISRTYRDSFRQAHRHWLSSML